MEINFNDWEFHDLAKELNGMTLHQMLNKHKRLDVEMTTIANGYIGMTLNGKSKNEEKYNELHRQQVFVAVRIAKEMTGV